MSKKTRQQSTAGQTPAENKTQTQQQPKPDRALPLWILPCLYCIVFAALAWTFLVGHNSDTLFQMQERGYWNDSMLFFNDCMRFPGGLLSWAGAYLTQYFFRPETGAAMLLLLWTATFWTAKWSFRIRSEWSFLIMIPLVALLCTQTQLGYWIYYLKDIDYAFYHSLGLFLALLLATDFPRLLPQKWQMHARLAQVVIVTALCYRPLGIYAVVAAGMVAARTLRLSWRWGIAAIASALVAWGLIPIIQTSGNTMILPDDRWTFGFHRFEIAALRCKDMELPFLIACIVPLLLPLFGTCKEGLQGKVCSILHVQRSTRLLIASQILMLITAAGAWYFASTYDRGTANFHSELRMAHAIQEQRWDDVLAEAQVASAPTRVMTLLRDIALTNKQLLHTRYDYNNQSPSLTVMADSIVVRIGDTFGDLIYYSFGETNFAIRRNIERTMHFGYSYYTMKLLTQCAIVNGEYDVARKYLDILERSTFQRQWAESVRPLLGDSARIAEDPRFRTPVRFHEDGLSLLGTDDDYVELTLVKMLSSTPSYDPEKQEVILLFSMQSKSPEAFWPQLHQWLQLNPGKKLPQCIQEAAIVYHNNMNTGPDLSLIPIEAETYKRYNDFFADFNQYLKQGMTEESIASALRPKFGKTYMWDFFALKNTKSY